MESTRLLCTGALVEVAGVLMQEGGQNGVTDKACGRGVSEASPRALAISFCTLLPLTRTVSSLLDAGPPGHAGEENWIGETFVCQVELHPRGERLGMGFVGHIKYSV